MDCINADKPFIYSSIEQKIYITPNKIINTEDNGLSKKHKFADLSDDRIDLASKRKAYREYTNDPSRIITGIVGAGIPIVHSLACGIAAKGSTAVKANAALNTAKDWGLVIAGFALYNKVVKSILNSTQPTKKFTEDHPGATSLGIILSGATVANAAVRYGNKALAGLFGKNSNQTAETKLADSAIIKNKTLGKIITNVENFAKSRKGTLISKFAIMGTIVLVVKNLFDLGKIDNRIAGTKENLKQKRFEDLKALANDLREERNI